MFDYFHNEFVFFQFSNLALDSIMANETIPDEEVVVSMATLT